MCEIVKGAKCDWCPRPPIHIQLCEFVARWFALAMFLAFLAYMGWQVWRMR